MSIPETNKLVRKLAIELFGNEIGCLDGNCVFGHRGGQHTNGGCQCLKGERTELRINLLKMSKLAKTFAERLSDAED